MAHRRALQTGSKKQRNKEGWRFGWCLWGNFFEPKRSNAKLRAGIKINPHLL
jgi:hypothetical protein